MRRNFLRLLKYVVGSAILVGSGVTLLNIITWAKLKPRAPAEPPALPDVAMPDPHMKQVRDFSYFYKAKIP